MYSIGIDILSISRVKEWIKDADYLDKVLTEKEKGYILGKRYPHRYLATYLAAKEAVMKALGTGWSFAVGWKDIEVIPDENGRPAVELHSKAKTFAGDRRIFLSTAYAGDAAVAFIILEEETL